MYDNEYCVESFVYKESLYTEYVREVVKPQYGLIQVGKRSACHSDHESIDMNKTYVQQIVENVRPMLIEDGFKTIQIEVEPYKQCYDVIKCNMKIFDNVYWREREYTEEVLGYIVKFYVSW